MLRRRPLNKILGDIEGSRNAFGRHPHILLAFYLLEVVWPSLRKRSCSFRRSVAGVLGLNATRYQSGWLRSRESHASVVESALGCRATVSRIAAYGGFASRLSVFEFTLACALISRSRQYSESR